MFRQLKKWASFLRNWLYDDFNKFGSMPQKRSFRLWVLGLLTFILVLFLEVTRWAVEMYEESSV